MLKLSTLYPTRSKPVKTPPGFILLQDTREQKPLFGDEPYVSTATLTRGDYSIKYFDDLFTVERKQLSDFYGYIGRERYRTTSKMEVFRDMIARGGWAGLAIEATEADLLTGYVMSKVPPEVARQALVSFEVRYGVHVFYSRSRHDIARWILDRAIKFYRIQMEGAPS